MASSAAVTQGSAGPARQPVRFYGANWELLKRTDLELCADGPAGTGKTVTALHKIHAAMSYFPGARALISRKTNVDLAASAMVSFRTQVLNAFPEVTYFGGNRIKPPAFQYPNGSEIVVMGLDKPEKVKSNEYDIALINECTECELEDYELVLSRLRHGVMPYQQLITDVNPTYPRHWLNQRMHSGLAVRLSCRHTDNPRWYNHDERGAPTTMTLDGELYIGRVLGALTGVRRERLLLGRWVAAEGLVHPLFDRRVHVIKPFNIPREWPRYRVIDFGYTHPFVCQWYAEDNDGRLYMYREIYMSKRTVPEHAEQILKLSQADPWVRETIADPEDADGRAQLQRAGIPTVAAHKDVTNGLQAVDDRLRLAGDKLPRLFYVEGATVEADPEMIALKAPTSTIAEYDGYIWDLRDGRIKGETPIKDNDHGQDATRYMVAARDLARADVQYLKLG